MDSTEYLNRKIELLREECRQKDAIILELRAGIVPLPTPRSDSEQESLREFYEWADKNDLLHQGAVTIAAGKAWQAALASKSSTD